MASAATPDATTRASRSTASTPPRASRTWSSSTRGPRSSDGRLVTNGGRILGVTAVGDSLAEARAAAYAAVAHVDFAGVRYRRDIAAVAACLTSSSGSSSARSPTASGCSRRSTCSTRRAIGYEFEVRSAHRTPDAVAEYARTAAARAACASSSAAPASSAALPGVVASHTDLPVIGVPLRSSSLSVLDGLDALLAIAQMPPGVPVATVGVDNAKNAAVLAARILGA